MEAQGIDLLLVRLARQPVLAHRLRRLVLLYAADGGGEPRARGAALDRPQDDAVGAKFTAFLDASNVVPYPDTYVGAADKHPIQFVAEELVRRGWDKGTIGVETDDYIIPPSGTRSSGGPAQREVRRCLPAGEPLPHEEVAGRAGLYGPGRQIAAAGAEGRLRQGRARRAPVRRDGRALQGHHRRPARLRRDVPVQAAQRDGGRDLLAPHLSWTDEKLVKGDIFYIEMGGGAAPLSLAAFALPLSRQAHRGDGHHRQGDRPKDWLPCSTG